jgi:hypothetical protein
MALKENLSIGNEKEQCIKAKVFFKKGRHLSTVIMEKTRG